MLEGGEVEWHSFLSEDKGRVGTHQYPTPDCNVQYC
jgi:hypothetical protein